MPGEISLPFTPIAPADVREFKVYVVVHRASGKMYVGATRYPVDFRWRHHLSEARRKHRLHPFIAAISEHGEHAFNVHVVASGLSADEASRLEKEFVATLGTELSGWNASRGGRGCSIDRKSMQTARHKRIAQYTLDGTLIDTFRCARDAHTANGFISKTCCGQNIRHAAAGRQKAAYGFLWKYLDNE